jgi:hypothetical protein
MLLPDERPPPANEQSLLTGPFVLSRRREFPAPFEKIPCSVRKIPCFRNNREFRYKNMEMLHDSAPKTVESGQKFPVI